MSRQIPLDLSPDPEFTFDNFIISDSNFEAAKRLKAWPDSGFPILILTGPRGVGKTHLLQALKNKLPDAREYQHGYDGGLKSFFDQNMIFDDADRASEETLFTLINMALNGEVRSLLLTTSKPVADWDIELPDLRSRLSNIPSIALLDHDDGVLEPILRKLFEDKGRAVSADLIQYILIYCDRSIAALTDLVDDLDLRAREQKKDLTKAFAVQWLRSKG